MRVWLFVAPLLLSSSAIAQDIVHDTTFVAAAYAHAVRLYEDAQIQSRLVNGSEYVEYLPAGEENPTFLEDCQLGSVFYDGDLYEKILLLYDLTSDKLVIEYKGNHLQLDSKKISYFLLDGRKFANVNINNHSGFYEVLRDGATPVLCRREKSRQETIERMEVIVRFDFKMYYLIGHQGQYFRVRSKEDVLKVLSDRRTEVRKFINEKSLNPRRQPEEALIQIAGFYDGLNQNP